MLPEKFDSLVSLGKRIASEISGVSIALQALFQGMSGKIFDYTPEQKMFLDNPLLPWGENIKHHQSPDKVRKVYRGDMKKIHADGSIEPVNPPELIAKGENNWLGWRCYIGVENIVIDFEGNIRRGWCNVGGSIGNIQDTALFLPTKPINCTNPNCHCGLDIMATKESASYKPNSAY
jgi:hypothetical protein